MPDAPDADSDAYWLGSKGPLRSAGLRQMLRRLGTRADVADLHAHRFRHTFAHRWLASGGNEGDLMELTGWRARQMLTRYASSAASERALDAHDRLRAGRRIRDAALQQLHLSVGAGAAHIQMRQVGPPAGREVIQHAHPIATGDEARDQV